MQFHNGDAQKSLTFVFAAMGRYQVVECAMGATLRQLERVVRTLDATLVVGFEDHRWLTTPLAQCLSVRFPVGSLDVFCGERRDTPASLFNEGARRSNGKHLVFVWPGCDVDSDAIAAASERATLTGHDWEAYVAPTLTASLMMAPEEIAKSLLSYFLSCTSLFPLSQAIVAREGFFRLGGFDTNPLLQRSFDTEYWMRSARQGQSVGLYTGVQARLRWTWQNYPLENDFRVPRHVAHSYRLRTSLLVNSTSETRAELTAGFLRDLSPALARHVDRLLGGTGDRGSTNKGTPPYKVAVTGGVWEYTHNQLGFFNHFQQLASRGLFTYIPLLDPIIEPETDLRGMDMVIISRGRHNNVLKILEYCGQHAIPTLYMIDDNWFSVGKDWPEPYAKIFAPGFPNYDVFVTCLRKCDGVLVYNDLLAEDVAPYARRIIRLPLNIRRADFTLPLKRPELLAQVESLIQWREKTGGVIAGYMGSVRNCDAAFEALAAVSHRYPGKVKILLFGSVTQTQRDMFDRPPVVLPYAAYEHYAATVGHMKPDILVAPLDSTHTSMSKVPNKYLEYSMAGAVGVYSDTPLYAKVIRDGINGLLVRTDEVSAWSEAIFRLVEDPALRRRIAAAARDDVLMHYETAVVAPLFADTILGLIRGRASAPPTFSHSVQP